MSHRPGAPVVSGISPREGLPGCEIVIRGENLGTDPSDLIALFICNTDCLVSAKWKSPSKIIARLGQAGRGVGDIVIVTKSGGRGISEVKFRVFIEEVSPLQESSVWVDESLSVPGRNVVRAFSEATETDDMLGLRVDPNKKLDQAFLARMFPEGSGNRRMESFTPAWYLLENHKYTKLEDLRKGIEYLKKEAEKGKKSSKDVHKSNLYALISCVDALHKLYVRIEEEKSTRGWPLTSTLNQKIEESKSTADKLFKDVLNRKDTADCTRNALSVLTRFRFIFFLPETIDENMVKGDYATILNDYSRAKSLFKDSEVSLFKEVMVVLDKKMEKFKKELRQKLIDPTTFEEQSKLIKYLKILDPNSDPSWECITTYHIWLEDILWQLQEKHYKAAVNEEKQLRDGFLPPIERVSANRQHFVTELLNILTDKLQSFWKLAQSYSNASDEKYLEQQDGVNQMLTNTINVSSWLMLNALSPSSLPEKVTQQYKDQFVKWPEIPPKVQIRHFFFALQALRSSIKSLLEYNFTHEHVQPLIELCMTIRLQTLSSLCSTTSDDIIGIAERENWKTDVVGNESKTSLPDMYESVINEMLPQVKQILSSDGYPGETAEQFEVDKFQHLLMTAHSSDLFSLDVYRQVTHNLFSDMITSIKECYDKLLCLSPAHQRPTHLRPNPNLTASSIDDSASVSSATEEQRSAPRILLDIQQPSSRKFLISVCNMECIINHSLPLICKRLADNNVKFADVILEKTKIKLAAVRQNFILRYLGMKQAPLNSLVDSASYDKLPEIDDVSSFTKELLMCIVFIQSELYQIAPQHLSPMLTHVIEVTTDKFLARLNEKRITGKVTQVVIDLTALERTLKGYLSLSKRKEFSRKRAELMDKLNHENFNNAMATFETTMELAIRSLDATDDEAFDALESSRIKLTDLSSTSSGLLEEGSPDVKPEISELIIEEPDGHPSIRCRFVHTFEYIHQKLFAGMNRRLILVLILLDVVFLVARFAFERAGAPHLGRIFTLLFIELAMLMVSTFIYKRISSIPPRNKSKSWPNWARKGLKIFALTWCLLAHMCWIFFYVNIPEDFFFAVLCFIALGFFIHVGVGLFTFFFIERLAHILVPLSQNPILKSESWHTSIAVILALLLTIQGVISTSYRPTVKNLNVFIRDLPEEFDGLQITLITDIHIGPSVGFNRVSEIVQVVNQQNPDLIAIVGDLVDGYVAYLGKRAKPLKDLRARHGKYVALGNHEYFHEKVDNWIHFFENDLNLTTLVNDAVILNKGGNNSICFGGVDDIYSETVNVLGHRIDPEKALEKCPKNAVTVMLAHQPNSAARILSSVKNSGKRVDLILSGHTHAGQMYVTYPLSFLSNTFFYGLYYHSSGAQVYVSSGVNYWGSPIKMLPRLCEIVNVRLHSAPSENMDVLH